MSILKVCKLHLAVLLLCCSACAPFIKKPGARTDAPRLERAHFIAADRAVLPVRVWRPALGTEKAVIIALHGFNDYSRFFEAPGRFLSRQGITCYAYDQRGFGMAPGNGLWAGSEAYIRDLAEFAAAVRSKHSGKPIYVLGESMGGAVAMAAMTGGHPPPVDGLILSAPAVWGRETMPWYQRWLLALTVRLMPWLSVTGEGLKILPSDNLDMLRGLGRDPRVIKATRVDTMYGLVNLMDAALESSSRLPRIPTLILYGEKDQVVPKEPVFRMLHKLPAQSPIRTAFYENGYHMLLRDLEADKPWNDILAWIGDRDAPLPSGADKRGLSPWVVSMGSRSADD